MRLPRIFGAVLFAGLALSASAVSGVSAHEFEASSSGLWTIKAHSQQLFRFPKLHFVCGVLGHSKAALKTLTQLVTVQYKGCSTSSGTVQEPITAEYEFSADGTVAIKKTVIVTVKATGLECKVTIPVQSGLGTITYTNINSETEILFSSNVTGITSTGAGSLCTYGTDKTGNYTGSMLVALVGGSLKWV